jgi:hypothetical protein
MTTFRTSGAVANVELDPATGAISIRDHGCGCCSSSSKYTKGEAIELIEGEIADLQAILDAINTESPHV